MEHLREDDPETIGPYRLYALLGRGGWGNVYYARRESNGRGVALKTIRPEHLAKNPEHFRSRFAREVEAARAVDSTYTAEVVDADTQAAAPWFATGFIRGIDLATALELCEGPLPERTWRVLATGLLDALRSIHAAGLVHRDLKLGNVLLANDGPRVIDFGIARHLAPVDGATLTGTVAPGTISFASPEQLRNQPVGPASDVFALGLVLAYAALNRHPFGPGSVAEIGSNILRDRPRLAGLPPLVDKVVRPCLEQRPQNRPQPAELVRLLPTEASPKEKDWLPWRLRAALEDRSGIAVDLEEPMRLRRDALPWPASAPTPADVLTPPGVRRRQEREPASNQRALPVQEATTLPPPDARGAAEPQAAPVSNDPASTRKAKAHAGLPGARHRPDAEAGDTEAMRRVALSFRSDKDWKSALEWYLRAAEAGNPTAAREAAQTIEWNFPDQSSRVVPLYRMAAEGGDANAAMRLGELMEKEPGGLEEALTWYGKAAAADNDKAAKAVLRLRTASARNPMSAEERTVLREHQAAAQEGQLNSMLALARWYQSQKRDEDALVWYRRGAEAGHAHAMLLAAQMLSKDGKRQTEALDWYRKAAEAGNTQALSWLGRSARQEGQLEAALAHFLRAADKAHVLSMTDAAEVLEQTGQRDRALEWYRRAAATGYPRAVREVERLSARPTPSTPAPKKSAARPSEPPAPAPKPKKANPAALREQALAHERNGRLEEALDCVAQAELLGDPEAKREVARLSLLVRDRTADAAERRRLSKRARRRYRELAQAGDLQAIQTMAALDPENAYQWHLRAAEAGSTKAMRAVARAHLDAGTSRDDRTALSWLQKAGEAGNTAAILDGARALETRGDYRNAIGWYQWAEANGDPHAAQEATRVQAEHPGAALLRRVSERLRRTWA